MSVPLRMVWKHQKNRLQFNYQEFRAKLKRCQKHKELWLVWKGRHQSERGFTITFFKKAETAILLASTNSDNRIVDKARASYKPIKPVPNQTYSFAILLGLLIPAIFVFVKEALNDKIKDGSDLENNTSIPVLGLVGYNEDHDNQIVASKPILSLQSLSGPFVPIYNIIHKSLIVEKYL